MFYSIEPSKSSFISLERMKELLLSALMSSSAWHSNIYQA